jgi:two-component system phosphate regulon sensor histidine kinase PhoR
MDWSDAILLVAVAVILFLYIRLMLKNKRLRQMADEANRLRLEATEAERRNRQLKQEMTSNIAHELKTPVASIRGYLEILLGDKPVDDERRRHYIERSYSQTLRLSDLIQDVSLINKLEESADLFPRAAVDVRQVAQEAADELADKATAAGMSIENNLPSMPMQGNGELLYGIFRNLMENSVDYAGEGAKVVVETYKEHPDHYYIHYYDTGRGVPDEYLLRLFDRFVRIGEGRSRSDGGTGLGLSIVKHAVLFHGGEIYAKNRPEGGLEFFFSLKKQ